MTRKAIILTLDDDNGISEKAYKEIEKVCIKNKWNDILDKVRETEGRYYLPENHGLKN